MCNNDYNNCGCGQHSQLTNNNSSNKTVIIPIPGEKGEVGDKGDKFITLFAKNNSDTVPPSLTQTANPSGWSTQPPNLSSGEYRWYITGTVNYNNTILIGTWSIPVSDTLISYPYGAELDSEVFDI